MVGLNRCVIRISLFTFILAGMALLAHPAVALNRPMAVTSSYLPLVGRGRPPACGEIIYNTTWRAAENPIQVICDTTVVSGVTLTIEPGVTVRFSGVDIDLIISGSLQAIGSDLAPIYFQPLNGAQAGCWGRVEFLTGSSGILDHAILEYGGSQDSLLYIASDTVQVLNSVVKDSANTGIFIQEASPLISATQILSNTGSDHGGGMYNNGGEPSIRNNTFISNTANYGGGMYNDTGWPIIANNTFSGNVAYTDGGGLMNINGSPTIQENTFADNRAHNFGGALYNSGESNPTIWHNTFSKNSAFSNGGGMYTNRGSPLIWGNTFSQNSATSGGGLFISSNSAIVQNNIFDGNQATYGGGLWLGDFIYTGGRIEFNTFFGNTGSATGGGLYVNSGDYTDPPIQSNIMINNTAGEGGGIYVVGVITQLAYNDVWENTGGNYSGAGPGAHDISSNPRLVDPANGDFHLTAGSPCINKANPRSFPQWDFEGDLRPNGAAPDIGADEYYPHMK